MLTSSSSLSSSHSNCSSVPIFSFLFNFFSACICFKLCSNSNFFLSFFFLFFLACSNSSEPASYSLSSLSELLISNTSFRVSWTFVKPIGFLFLAWFSLLVSPISWKRPILLLVASFSISFLLLWIWVTLLPLRFLVKLISATKRFGPSGFPSST